jgi:hypothetical protein
LGQLHPFSITVSAAFPLAQKRMPVNFDSRKVGQLGQMHIFVFSSVSGTITLISQLHLRSKGLGEKPLWELKLNGEFEYFGKTFNDGS